MSAAMSPFEKRKALTGEKMLEVRKELGLSQTQVAFRLGVDQSAISEWESGKREPPEVVKHIYVNRWARKHFLVDASLRGPEL